MTECASPFHETIVAVSGGFDPIHVGHTRLIREAAALGSKLIVIVNNDEFLLRKKGFVFMLLEERVEILKSVKGVDSVVVAIDTDDTVCRTLEALKPAVFANGGDRTKGASREVEICRKIGCRDVYGIGGGKIQSSSELTKGISKEGPMENIEQMIRRHETEIKALEKSCSHTKLSEWMDWAWAPGHFAGRVKVCGNCGKVIKRDNKPGPLIAEGLEKLQIAE